jgi:hypothetical protein
MTLWELRFTDGRGASFFTDSDVTSDVGQEGAIKHIRVAATVFEASALDDARRCFEDGRVLELTASMGAVAYALRYET